MDIRSTAIEVERIVKEMDKLKDEILEIENDLCCNEQEKILVRAICVKYHDLNMLMMKSNMIMHELQEAIKQEKERTIDTKLYFGEIIHRKSLIGMYAAKFPNGKKKFIPLGDPCWEEYTYDNMYIYK